MYRVHPLMVGQAEVARSLDVFWSLTKETGSVFVPILAFLIEGGSHPILVDTGMRDPERAMDVHGLGPHRTNEEWTLESQLRRHDLDLDDIPTVILTHLHYDHAGGCDQLPSARFVLQRSELMAAAAPMGPNDLDIGGKDLFFDRKDVAGLVDDLWDRVDLLEGDADPSRHQLCGLSQQSHSRQSMHLCRDRRRRCIDRRRHGAQGRAKRRPVHPPGLFYDLESMRRAVDDIKVRSDRIFPAHDPEIAPSAT